MKFIVLTNNPKVAEKSEYNTRFIDGTYMDVLVEVRNFCHRGHKLLSHPLSGSVKPNETPFKSIMVSEKSSNETDEESILLIEKAIETCEKFPSRPEKWTAGNLLDYQLIDSTLIASAVESAAIGLR